MVTAAKAALGAIGIAIGGGAGIIQAVFLGAAAYVGTAASISLLGSGGRKSHMEAFPSPTYTTGKLITQTNSSLSIPIVYGQVKMAGNVIWNDGSSEINRLVSFCFGEISNISEIQVNGLDLNQLTGATFDVYTGNGTQTIDSRIPGATQADKAEVVGGLKHEAYIALTVQQSDQIDYNYNLTALIDGKKVRVYTDTTTYTTVYSNNPIWCLLDFLTGYNSINIDRSSIDIQSFIDAAAYCDKLIIEDGNASYETSLTGSNNDLVFTSERDTFQDNEIKITYVDPAQANQDLSIEISANEITVNLATDSGSVITSTASDIKTALEADSSTSAMMTIENATANDGSGVVTAMSQQTLTGSTGTEKRFTLNTAIDTSKSALEWIQEILLTCQGYLCQKGEFWSVFISKKETSLQSFTADDINDFQAKWLSMDDVFDIVNVNYKDPAYEWTYVQARAEADTYLRDERPFVKTQDINGLTVFNQASRLAFFYLNESHSSQMIIDFKTSQKALNRTIGDIISITDYVIGFSGKKYRILAMAEAENDQIKITAREYNENLFTDAKGSVAPTVNVFTSESRKILDENGTDFILAEDGTYLLFD